MAVPQSEDPYDWDEDDVVAALCNPTHPFLTSKKPRQRPEPVAFARALREHRVDGEHLLTMIGEEHLRNDFDLRILKHQGVVLGFIKELRKISPKYRAHQHTPDHAGEQKQASNLETLFETFISRLDTVLSRQDSSAGGALATDGALVSKGNDNSSSLADAVNLGADENNNASGQSLATASPRKRLGETIVEHMGKKRRRLVLDAHDSHVERSDVAHGTTARAVSPISNVPPHSKVSLASEAPTTDIAGVSTALTSSWTNSSSNQLPNPNPIYSISPPSSPQNPKLSRAPSLNGVGDDHDTTAVNPATAENEDVSEQTIHKPGETVIDSNGRKRMRPILISQPESDAAASSDHSFNEDDEALEPQRTSQSPTQMETQIYQGKVAAIKVAKRAYLGARAYPVERIFYGATKMGQEVDHEVDDSENFTILSSQLIGNGHRTYVNNRLKYFLSHPETRLYRQGGEELVGFAPYPERIAKRHAKLSMSLFSRSAKGSITAIREDRMKWERSIETKNPGLDDLLISTLGENEVNDWDYLEKWKFQADAGELLPIYGESGSEGEYDLDTWREMEEENSEISRQSVTSKSKKIDEQEVDEAIDETITSIVEDWKNRKLPKIESTGWRLWIKSRRDNNKHEQIDFLKEEIDRLERRLSKLKGEIRKESWSSALQVKKQSKVLQESVFDRESCHWKIRVLQSKTPPQKPPPRTTARTKKVEIPLEPLAEDEEDLEESSSSVGGSDSDLDGFIVGDEAEAEEPPEPSSGFPTTDANSGVDVDGDSNVLDDVSPQYISESESEDDMVSLSSLKLQEQDPSRRSSHIAAEDEPTANKNRPGARPLTAARPGAELSHHPVVIDLTQQSDSPEPEPAPTKDQSLQVKTPSQNLSDDDPFRRNRTAKSEFKTPVNIVDLENDSQPSIEGNRVQLESIPEALTLRRRGTASSKSISVSSRSSTTEVAGGTGDDEKSRGDVIFQPGRDPIEEVDKISKTSLRHWKERQDRHRLLVCLISRYDHKQRTVCADLLKTYESYEPLETDVWIGMRMLRQHRQKFRGLDPEHSQALMCITSWWISFSQCSYATLEIGINVQDVRLAQEDEDNFEEFFKLLSRILKLYESGPFGYPSSSQPNLEDTPTKKRQKILRDDPDDAPSSQKKRKYAVQESAEARDLRADAQQRVRDRDARQKQLQSQLQEMGLNEMDPSQMIVNAGKFEDQAFIHLNPKIARLIQPHQLSGVQFMWREIVDVKEGCLLAHTMGLGKTMQVITLLVTKAEAARSADKTVREQIPSSLAQSQTLIICPVGLIENWWEELLRWTPVPAKNSVGEIRKVTSAMKVHDRLFEIQEWNDEGGILLIGYTTYRNFVENKVKHSQFNKSGDKTKAMEVNHEDRPLSETEHANVLKILLERPNLVVADEAHTMKNRKSGTSYTVTQIKTKSRIALTGSPLSNNLEEYFSLVDWIAPGYLGDLVQFRARYVEPIQEGLYQESTAMERRISLKMLHVLKSDLDPKVHRADMSVLRDRLKGKTEFIIRVGLSELQESAYRLYVQTMLQASRSSEPGVATVWAWLSSLRLLCNHPKCFKDKLESPENSSKKKTKQKEDKKGNDFPLDEDFLDPEKESAILDAPVTRHGIPQSCVDNLLVLLTEINVPIDTVSLAFKMEILMQILDFSLQANDKVLIFSHSLLTLNYIETLLNAKHWKYRRLDGKTNFLNRQQLTRDLNKGIFEICLISTAAGGQGLNMFGANRVVIIDDHYNPMWEEQAIGRAYRIGQQKPVFVYRLTVGGTFEEPLQNQSLFKQQLASRVVDKKNPVRHAQRKLRNYLFEPRQVDQEDLSGFVDKDPLVLDRILDAQGQSAAIRSIDLCETFQREEKEELTAEEKKDVEVLQSDEKLRRSDPIAYEAMLTKRQREAFQRQEVRESPNAQAKSTAAASTTNRQISWSLDDILREPVNDPMLLPSKAPPASVDQGITSTQDLLPVAGAGTRVRQSISPSRERLPTTDRQTSNTFDNVPRAPVEGPMPPSSKSSPVSVDQGVTGKQNLLPMAVRQSISPAREMQSFPETSSQQSFEVASDFMIRRIRFMVVQKLSDLISQGHVQAEKHDSLCDLIVRFVVRHYSKRERTVSLQTVSERIDTWFKEEKFLAQLEKKSQKARPNGTNDEQKLTAASARAETASLISVGGSSRNSPAVSSSKSPGPIIPVSFDEVISRIPEEGVGVEELVNAFKGRVSDGRAFIRWVTEHSKIDKKTRRLYPRKGLAGQVSAQG